nr:MAG TPA: hypothetical protein [Bacteriophage sp.]
MIFFKHMIFICSGSPADLPQQQIVECVKGCNIMLWIYK